jgi:hypothetical protein
MRVERRVEDEVEREGKTEWMGGWEMTQGRGGSAHGGDGEMGG